MELPIVATYHLAGGQGAITSASSMKKMRGVATNVYFEKNFRKAKKNEGLRVLKIRVRELFTCGEGISTLRVHHKGRQPLIECAIHDFKIMYFPFLCLLFFLGSTKVLPLLLRILRCNEEFRPT